jgi:filamentous hemagglutinin
VGISRTQARGIEQALIEDIGRVNQSTGTLLNKINSIAQSNPIYQSAVAEGRAILQQIGFK